MTATPLPVHDDGYVPAHPEPRLVTLVVTVRSDLSEDDLAQAVRDVVQDDLGAEIVPCDWAPDADTITDAVGDGSEPVVVIDLNPPRPLRPAPTHWVCQGCDAEGKGVGPSLCPNCLGSRVCTFDPA